MSDTKNNKIKAFLKEYVPYLITIILVILVKKYIVTPIKVNGDSMYDTLKDGDIMILNIIDYRLHGANRFDIVVADEGTEYLIKRVIGLPGEKIEYKDNQLYVNGKKIKDSYATEKTDDFVVEVPKDSYFIMGDNRTNSVDSRRLGAFKKNELKGITKLTIFPFSRFGNKK